MYCTFQNRCHLIFLGTCCAVVIFHFAKIVASLLLALVLALLEENIGEEAASPLKIVFFFEIL